MTCQHCYAGWAGSDTEVCYGESCFRGVAATTVRSVYRGHRDSPSYQRCLVSSCRCELRRPGAYDMVGALVDYWSIRSRTGSRYTCPPGNMVGSRTFDEHGKHYCASSRNTIARRRDCDMNTTASICTERVCPDRGQENGDTQSDNHEGSEQIRIHHLNETPSSKAYLPSW